MTTEMKYIDELWDFSNPAVSETRFRALLEEDSSTDNPSLRAEVLTQIARAQGLQGSFDEAHATLDTIPGDVIDSSPLVRVRVLLERGRLFNSSGKPEKSVPLFLEAWKTSDSPALDYYAVDAAHMLAIVTPANEQVGWAEKAIALAKSKRHTRTEEWLGPLYNNLGWTHHDAGRYDEALTSFEAAMAAFNNLGTEKQVRIARWTVARAHRSLGNVEQALALQQALLAELDAAGETDGYVHEEIAECLLALSRPDEATPHFAKAYALLSEDTWLVKHEGARIERLRALASHTE